MIAILLVLCTCPDRRTALDLATPLVQEGLAACVNITAPITSVYRWQGKVEQAEECLLLIKTGAARYQELEDALRSRHPYELPEIIAVPIQHGLTGYLQWVEQCTTAS
jgi:periplasmic divalent cation tolerance protein